jgi:hypothetical protein
VKVQWCDIVERQVGRTNKRSAAALLGKSESTLRRWCLGESPSIDTVVHILRHRPLPADFVADVAALLRAGTGLDVQPCQPPPPLPHRSPSGVVAVEDHTLDAHRVMVELHAVVQSSLRDDVIDAGEALAIGEVSERGRRAFGRVGATAIACATTGGMR